MSYLRRLLDLDVKDDAESYPPPFNYFSSPYADLFVTLTGDIGTAADLGALLWAEQNGWPNVAETLRAADRRCEALAAGDDDTNFRAEVRRLVELFRSIRAAHAKALQ